MATPDVEMPQAVPTYSKDAEMMDTKLAGESKAQKPDVSPTDSPIAAQTSLPHG